MTDTTPDAITAAGYSKPMCLADYAKVINADWRKQKSGVYFGAVPYIEAFRELTATKDGAPADEPYYAETARGQVNLFLCNAGQWRGPVARQVKAELKKAFGIK